MAEFSWETSGATPSPSYNPCEKNCVSQFIERDGFQFLSNKRNFPSRNWHTGMAKSLDDLMYIWD